MQVHSRSKILDGISMTHAPLYEARVLILGKKVWSRGGSQQAEPGHLFSVGAVVQVAKYH